MELEHGWCWSCAVFHVKTANRSMGNNAMGIVSGAEVAAAPLMSIHVHSVYYPEILGAGEAKPATKQQMIMFSPGMSICSRHASCAPG